MLPLLHILPFLSVTTAQSPVQVVDHAHNLTYIGYKYSGVDNFQGIRYGKDTSGENRFRHPKAFTYANGTTVDATKVGASCPQNTVESIVGFTENPGVYQLSEDCLNLRVARPTGTKQDAQLPVMVWIYGGTTPVSWQHYRLTE